MPERKTCMYLGCTKLGRHKGRTKGGKQRWGRYCEKHHKYKGHDIDIESHPHYNGEFCQRCKWAEGPCDHHRKDNTKSYKEKDNVVILCPNCHRLVTFGIITI